MEFYIKLSPKGVKRNKFYNIVVLRKKIGIKSSSYAKIGHIENLVDGTMLYRVNNRLLALWLLRGAKIDSAIERYII